MKRPFPSLLRDLWRAYAFHDDPTLSPRHKRAVLMMAVVSVFGGVAIWGYALFYTLLDLSNLWPAALLCIVAGMMFLLTPAVIRQNVVAGCVFLLAWGITFFFVLGYFFGRESGLNLGMFTGCVLALLILGTSRPVTLALIITPGALIGFGLPYLFPEPALDGVTPALLRMIYHSNVATLSSTTAMALFLAVRQVEIAETALAVEHDRSEALLSNLLPTNIAARLKAAPDAIIADDIPQMTILFADIVDFTPRASRMQPEELVQFLNRVFSTFDTLTAKHGLE